MHDRLQTTLRQLRLSGLSQTLDVRLRKKRRPAISSAMRSSWNSSCRMNWRKCATNGKSAAASQTARSANSKPLDEFDWAFNPSLPRKQVFDLATCRFVREHRDVLVIGPPGTGKSYVAQAVGWQAIKLGFVVLYRSIFDVVRDFLHENGFGRGGPAVGPLLEAGPADYR